jgi:hypothetical protein
VPDVAYCRAYGVAHIFLTCDGDVIADRPNPTWDGARIAREAEAEARRDRQEYAMQMGMAFGCQGYNDAMGW